MGPGWYIRLVKKPVWISACGLFLFALGWRLVYLHQAAQSPLFDTPVVDAQTYFQQAERFATHFSLGDEPFWQPPLYPAFLGLLHLLFGPSFYAYRLVQFALGALSVTLLYLIGRRVFSPGVGLAAGLIASVYGPLLYFEGELLPPVLGILLNLGLLLLLLRDDTPQSKWVCLAAGLGLGLAAAAIPTVLPFALCVVGWLILRSEPARFSARLVRALVFVLGIGAVLGGIAWRNWVVGRDVVLLSSNSGLNFYIGNNADFPRTAQMRPGTEWYNLIQRPQQAGLAKPSEQSAYFWQEAFAFIKERPVDYVSLQIRKIGLFWQGGEIRRNTDMYFARRYSSLLSAQVWHDKLAFPFGLVAPLALVGLVLAAKGRKGGLILLFVLSYAGAVIAFFPTARYRLPLIPLLILLACYAGAWIKASLFDRQWRVVLPLGTVLLLAWSVNAGAITWQDDAQEHFYTGLAYARKGLEARSTLELHKALQLDPEHYDARFKLAEQYWNLGETDRAEGHYRRLIEQAPRETAPRRNLGNLYLESGRIEAALVLFREIVELEPEKARSHFGLAGAYRTGGLLEQAEAEYRKALELDPDHFDARYNLAYLYDQKGEDKWAEREYRRLLARQPERGDLHNNLGVVFLKRRDFAAAAAAFGDCLALEPSHRGARRNLAVAYEGLGRYDEAVQQYEYLVRHGEEEQVHNHLARLYRKLGNLERAEEEMRRHRMLVRGKEVLEIVRGQAEDLFERGAPR